MADDDVWKRRFAVFALLRLTGLAIFFLGVAIAFSDLVKEGGWPLLGGLLAIAGLIDSVFVPKLVRKSWDREDSEKRRS